MRVIFNEELKAVADDLDHMVKGVRKAINGAGDALLNQNLEAAQAVIDGDIEIDALEERIGRAEHRFAARRGDHGGVVSDPFRRRGVLGGELFGQQVDEAELSERGDLGALFLVHSY